MTHSEAAPCTAETNANWIDSLLRDWRAGRKKRPRNGPRRRNFGTRRPMGILITAFTAAPESGVNSGLVRAKDSITSLKEKTTKVNQHVQTLQSPTALTLNSIWHWLAGISWPWAEDSARREVSSLAAQRNQEGALQEALRLLGGRMDGFLGQWEWAQQEQAQSARGLQELRGRADELCTMVERSAVSVASLKSELEALGPVKPILEELGRQLQNTRRGGDHVLNLDRSAQGSCARCASPVQQALQSSPQELERQALAKQVRAEALSSILRLAQDEAVQVKNLLLTDKMSPE
ncbi:testis-specific serine kinase substrate [Cricetulus griseus]